MKDEIVLVYCYVCGIENNKEATECEYCHKKDTLVEINREQKDEIIRQMFDDIIHNQKIYPQVF